MLGFRILTVIMFVLTVVASVMVGNKVESNDGADKFIAGWNNFIKISPFTFIPFALLSSNLLLGFVYIVVGTSCFEFVVSQKK